MESLADGEREARAVKKHGHPVEEVTADDGFSVEGDHTCQTAQPRQTHARRVDRRGPRLTADAYQEEPTDERGASRRTIAAGTRVQSAPLSTSDATRTSSSLSGEPT